MVPVLRWFRRQPVLFVVILPLVALTCTSRWTRLVLRRPGVVTVILLILVVLITPKLSFRT